MNIRTGKIRTSKTRTTNFQTVRINYRKHATCILIVSLFVFSNIIAQDFTLSGKLIGFEDNTRIILNPYLDNMDIDMDNEKLILLKDGKFEFTTNINKPTKYSLRVRPVEQDNVAEFENLFFWAENTSMKLEGEKGQVFQANISGSKIQKEYYEYTSSTVQYKNRMKQIKDSVQTNPNISKEKKAEMRVRYFACLEAEKNQRIEFVYNHPNYYCSAPEILSSITFFPDQIDFKELSSFYNQMNPDLKSNIYGIQIKAFLNDSIDIMKLSPLKIGDVSYDFILKDSSNIDVIFSALKSKIILLDFWASACGPCRLEHKNYVELYKEFGDKGFEIVSVSQDQSKKRWTSAMETDKMSWVSLWDKDKGVSNVQYLVSYLPTNFLINGEGIVIAKDLRGDKLRQELEKLFNDNNN